MVVEVGKVFSADPVFGQAAALFDAYRQHYGANPAPEAATAWLRAHLDTDRLRMFAAAQDGRARGILTLSVMPAALTLRTFWAVRDVYVAPEARRGGLARALLAHVADAARAEGAHRLSLQTEVDNTAARRLYAGIGFRPVTGLTQLILTL